MCAIFYCVRTFRPKRCFQNHEDDPLHHARLFEEAVEQESEAVTRKQDELTLKKLDQEIQDIEFATKRRHVETYADCYSNLERHGIRMDDRNRQAMNDYVDSTLQASQVHMIQDTSRKGVMCPNLPFAIHQ